MPVLRLPTDDTLGSTLGNLGQALANNLNPMNQLRGQELLQEMQQQRFELQRQQQIDAANQNAATVYERANPHNLSDADLAATVAGIRNGQYNPTATIDALKAAGGYAANQAAANMIDVAHPEWSSSQRASAKADILSGRKNLSEVESDFANAGIATNKSTATIGATNAARTAATSTSAPANAALAAEAAASGDAATAGKIIAQSNVLDQGAALPQDTPVNAPALTTLSTEQGIAGVPQTPPAQTAGPRAVADITGKTIVAQAAPRAPTSIVPIDPLTGQPVVVAPGATPPAGVFSQPAQGPDTKATAASTAAEASTKAATDYASAQLQDGMAEGLAGRKVQNDVNQLRRLGDLMDNTGLMTNAQTELASRLYSELGLTLNPGRKDEGIQRLALPEIQLGNISLPSSRMSHDALNQALDQFQARAQLADKVGQSALKYWGQGPTASNASAFLDERNKIYEPANNPTETIRKGRENAPPPPPKSDSAASPPAMKANPKGGWLFWNPTTNQYE
jgi:hypothetical protein